MTSFNIVDLFYAQAQETPDKVAIIDKNDTKITFGTLEKAVTETAFYFQQKGIGKGDRVLVFVPMSIDLYRTVLALFRIGATAVFLDEWVNMKRMALCCEVAQCKAFIGIWQARYLGIFSKALRKIPIWLGSKEIKNTKLEIKNKDFEFPTVFEEDTALLTFTTGTTGTPKAAKRTHGFLKAQLEALVNKLKPSPYDINMPALPIVLLINLATGTPSVIANFKASKPKSLRPEILWQQLKKYQVNGIISSPFVIKSLAEYTLKHNLSLPTLQKVFTGGAPVFPNEASLYEKAFPQARIEIVYGSTEAEPISSCLVQDCYVEKGLFVGKIDKNSIVKVIKIIDLPIQIHNQEELKALEMPVGEVGEIIVAGKHVLREYFNNEEALLRNKIFINGRCWHRTGDSGFICRQEIASWRQKLARFIKYFASWRQKNTSLIQKNTSWRQQSASCRQDFASYRQKSVNWRQQNASWIQKLIDYRQNRANSRKHLYLTGRCNMIIRRENATFFPFVFEYYLQQIEGIVLGTILEVKNEIIAFIELHSDILPTQKKAIEAQVFSLPAPIARICFLPALPRDLRHNSRIDYQALLRLAYTSKTQ